MADRLAVRKIPEIPGMYIIDLVLHDDGRGWFKESYQQEKMEALGLPRFDIVQNNFSYNVEKGTARGLHAEPWEKYISVANGKAFGTWIDLRKGSNFGQTFSMEITPETAVFIPRGVANGYQTLEDNVTYTYLVNAHWHPDVKYPAVSLLDPALGINWPISPVNVISEKDKNNPLLSEVQPMEF